MSKVEAGKFENADDVKVRSSSLMRLTITADREYREQTIDEQLAPKTFVAGESLTAADLAVFAAVHPYIVRPPHYF